jgi:hypothetical protein
VARSDEGTFLGPRRLGGMKPIAMLGLVLIALGVVGLVVANVSFTERKTVLDAGPIKITQEQEKTVPIPTIAGIAAVVVGLGLIFVGRR